MAKKFTKVNDSFTCIQCQKLVPASTRTCRNHCPYCLTSLHVDQFPGDRANICGGVMHAIDYFLDAKKGIVLVFECKKCGVKKNNAAALKKEHQPDDYDLILDLKKM